MSRTKRGGKGPGFDYWSRRPVKGTKPGGMASSYGPEVKRLTHRSERRIAAKIVRKEIEP